MIIFDQTALLLLILVPLIGAFLMAIMSKDRPKDIWYFAIFIASITLVISTIVFLDMIIMPEAFNFPIVLIGWTNRLK